MKVEEKFLSIDFDYELELKQLRQYMKIRGDDIEWVEVKKPKVLYVSSKFDKVKCWKYIGQWEHPLIFVMTPKIIALPSVNLLLGRMCSTYTWFEDML